MGNLSVSEINADISMITGSFSSDHRVIPSPSKVFRVSLLFPMLAVMLSFVSISMVYMSFYSDINSIYGYWDYFLSEGWAVTVPTAIIGLVFAFMTYNNIIMYMAIPEDVREKSLIFSHLRKVIKRTFVFFVGLMILSVILSGFISWFAFGIPALEFALFLVLNMIVGMEINRLGAGLALEKISNLIKKI